jgi:hypothetical protein
MGSEIGNVPAKPIRSRLAVGCFSRYPLALDPCLFALLYSPIFQRVKLEPGVQLPHQGTKDGKSTSPSCSNIHVLFFADNNRTHPISRTSNSTISTAFEMFHSIYTSIQATGSSASKYYEIPAHPPYPLLRDRSLAFISKMC